MLCRRGRADTVPKSLKEWLPRSVSGALPPPPQAAEAKQGFGAFGGVFTPSILTILGVIMYLRFGWVVGNVGLLGTLLIVTLSTSITFITALSICAIATNQRVKIGGAYYMVSRSLGLEAGGAIGIPLYFAQALSVALYTIGFAESVTGTFPGVDQRTVALITTVLVAVLAVVSAKTAIRTQYLIMAAIAISLISFAFGRPLEATEIEMWGAPARLSEGFWTVFAVFFPAVTGIMAGVNMSGDLKDPNRAIPRGTLAAVGTGYLIYMALPIFLAMRADAVTLIEDPLVMRRIAWWGEAILLGVWGATLSSAMGSILGAPRVLQALARDGVLPNFLKWLGKGSGQQSEPKLGTLVTMGVALVAVALGDLDVIAPILTMFFLATYTTLNFAAGIERFLDSPSFRPNFRVHWTLSLLGALACMAVMFLINVWATLVAAVVVIAILVWLKHRTLSAAWGDVRRGVWMALMREGLLHLQGAEDPKNWRPHLLVFSGAPTQRWHLIDLASALTQGRSLMTVSTVITSQNGVSRKPANMERTLREYLERRGVQALLRVVRSKDPFVGAQQLIESYGLGAVVPNTVMLGDSENPETLARYCQLIEHIHGIGRNLVVVREHPEQGFGYRERIDVWWGGLRDNGGLMMTLAYLLATSASWQDAEVHVKMVVSREAAAEKANANLQSIVKELRIGAKVEVLVSSGRSFWEILQESSQGADLVFLGMKAPGGDQDYQHYYQQLRDQTRALPTTAFVLAAESLEFGEILS